MGKQLGGINGPFLGKVGNIVGYQWKGRWVMRSVAKEFHDAKSELQLEQRSRLGAAMGLAARLRDILLVGLKLPAATARMTEYNYFYKINNDCLVWDGESLAVDYECLRVSEGPVAPVAFHIESEELRMKNEESANASVLRQPNSSLFTLHFSFDKNPEHRVSGSNDRVYVAAVCPSRGEAVLSLPVYRRMKRITVMLPQAWQGLEVQLYGLVQDNAGRASNSVYIGGGTLEELEESTQEEPTLDLSESASADAPLPMSDPQIQRPGNASSTASTAARSPS